MQRESSLARRTILTTLGLELLLLAPAQAESWQSKKAALMTRWAADVTPERALPEYPRPQMTRPRWQSLNGLWDLAIRPKDQRRPAEFPLTILVPFPVESALSGVMQRVDENQRLWYRRGFAIPKDWAGQRILLHFGAVDWEATVYVDGKEVGSHRGGYDPFSFDITDKLLDADTHELVVAVWDPTDAGPQPRGKQVRQSEGIWYTPTSGIWQTVWLEPVPAAHIQQLIIVPDIDGGRLRVTTGVANLPESDPRTVRAIVRDGQQEVVRATGRGTLELEIPKAKLWSPDTPFLYDLNVAVLDGEQTVDEVASYFGMRKIALGKDAAGTLRLVLNNQPLFMYGPLDQGFWPDGLYTAPTDAALRYDLEVTKELGCNLVRKHVKVEPQRWYHWCDKLGLLVWQDMPSGDRIDAPKDWQRPAESAAQFERELRAMVDTHRNHPCIVMWVPFNEGWGQYDTPRIATWLKEYDPTRLVNESSGWHDNGAGDVHDIHVYPGPGAPPTEKERAGVLGEFGGLGLPVPGHTWQEEKNWGYQSFKTAEELTKAYLELIEAVRGLIHDAGLAAAVYTQTTDVEIEVNGLMTYDRQIKIDAKRVTAANRELYGPPPKLKALVPTGQSEPVTWRYTVDPPPAGWERPDFADSTWKEGTAPFAKAGTRGVTMRTPWETPDIWLRREFQLTAPPAKPERLRLKVYHDEDCEVFLNGQPVAGLKGHTILYVLVPLADASALRSGRNVLAVHCHQTAGGQGIDVGLVEVEGP